MQAQRRCQPGALHGAEGQLDIDAGDGVRDTMAKPSRRTSRNRSADLERISGSGSKGRGTSPAGSGVPRARNDLGRQMGTAAAAGTGILARGSGTHLD